MDTHQQDWLVGGARRSVACERIVTSAARLFRDRGFDQVGMEQVATDAGCSRATLYRHFPGKPALIDAVLAHSAVVVTDRVAAQLQQYTGRRRIVEAILGSVVAVRSDPVLAQWFAVARSGAADGVFASSREPARIATALTGIAPDDEAAQWIVRIVLSLLAWPLPDAASERRMVERFVG
ncbi:TetR/AcrR family transcriptional regulator [Nocardia crassostreae]|uniref:TetR/AcrR family transcriptional regulator n=1 Tax=Nocardia crassostreae TaxID=53428 RepID=UPI00083770B8|nr:TetR/AcrR family transcriptional regulator [Nocardia crassostreae]